MLDAQLMKDAWGEDARGKCTTENCLKLLIKTTNAQLLKVDLLLLEQLCGGKALLTLDFDRVLVGVGEDKGCVLPQVAS